MKKAIQLLFVTLFIVTFTSCSSDSNNTFQEKLLKRIIEVNTDGTSSTFNFTYNGNKIVSINSEVNTQTFNYAGNLITRIIELNTITQLQTTFDYTYSNDKLTKVICSDNYELNYIYNENGTVSYEKTTRDLNNNIVLLFHGTFSFQGENIYEDKKILDTTGLNVLSKEEVSFVYDTKRNPLNNITGYNKLLDHFKNISANNATSSIETASTSFLETDQVVSTAIQLPRVFQYDNNDYPTETISDRPVFENQNGNHLKSLYFYE